MGKSDGRRVEPPANEEGPMADRLATVVLPKNVQAVDITNVLIYGINMALLTMW
jgi:hypothetical protein